MRLIAYLAIALLAAGAARAQTAPAWFTSGPRYERAAKCIAAIMFYPRIEENASELGVLQRAIASDAQLDSDMGTDIRTQDDPPRLKQLDLVLRHVYDAVRAFQTQPVQPTALRLACRKFEAELAR